MRWNDMLDRRRERKLRERPAPLARSRWRKGMRWTMAGFYGLAGLVHITAPEKFLPIVPDWIPFPRQVVLATGICEIAGGVALLSGRTRRLAGVMLALYAVGVFPANIKHAIEGIDLPPAPNSWWYHGPRLALQPVLVWWALFSSGAIDWPFRRARTPEEWQIPLNLTQTRSGQEKTRRSGVKVGG
jgi:uncharacterized membrane protein